MNLIFSIFLLSASVYLLGLGVNTWNTFISGLTVFSSDSEEESTEYVDEASPVPPRFDVDAFYRRMRDLEETLDGDGLFAYEFTPAENDDTSGVEIITEEYEIMKDNRR